MRRVFAWLYRLYLLHELSIINDAIADEVERHEEFPRRHQSWLRERALLMMKIDGVSSRHIVSYGLAGHRMERTRRSA